MDVVLLQDVEPLGARGAVVRVKPGYARNYLLPRGLAAAATPAQLRLAQEQTRQQQRKAQRLQDEAEALKRRLEGHTLSLKLNVGADGKAFGSVTAHEIAEALAAGGFTVEKRAVQLAEPIKTLGIYQVPVRVSAAVTASLKVWVVKA